MGQRNRKRNQQSKNGFDDEKEMDINDVVASIIELYPRLKSDKTIVRNILQEMNLKSFNPNDHELTGTLFDKIRLFKISQMAEGSSDGQVEENEDDEDEEDEEEDEEEEEEDDEDDDDDDEDDYNGK